MTCQGCERQPATWRNQWRTGPMSAPAFNYYCDGCALRKRHTQQEWFSGYTQDHWDRLPPTALTPAGCADCPDPDADEEWDEGEPEPTTRPRGRIIPFMSLAGLTALEAELAKRVVRYGDPCAEQPA